MPPRETEIERLKQQVRILEEQARQGREALERLGRVQKLYEDVVHLSDLNSRNIYLLQAAINMPQLYLDRQWRIMGYSIDFLLLFEGIAELSREHRHLADFLGAEGFSRIEDHLARLSTLEQLPYDEGGDWNLVYQGPNAGEAVGRDWVPFQNDPHWGLETRGGRVCLVHQSHMEDFKDCYLMSAVEYGDSVSDLKVTYRLRTPEQDELLRDISLVISSESGRDGILPDIVGYSICTASHGNIMARIQKQAADIVSQPEKLDPGAEYEVTAERIGGRISRRLICLADGSQAPPLVCYDSSPIYDRHHHLGFSTFAGQAEIFDIRIYTRPSRFRIENLRLDFYAELNLKEPSLAGRIFRLRLGPTHELGESFQTLLFEDITARKQMELALSQSEERYRSLVEMINDGMALLDENGRTTFVNRALCEMTGYSKEELLGKSPEFSFDEAGREAFRSNFDQRRLGSSTPYEVGITTKEGARLHLHVNPRALFDAEGVFRGSVVVLRDITERRRTEEALQRSRAQMRAVIDAIKSRIIFVNDSLEIVLANRSAARDLGRPPEELPGLKYCELWCSHGEDCEQCLPRKTLASGSSQQATRFVPGLDRRVLDMRSDPVYNHVGELLGAVIIIEDITSRKRAEELLRQSESRYRLLFENAGNPILLVDYDGVLQMLNNLAAGYLGGQPERLVGRSIFKVMPQSFARKRLEVIRRVIEEGKLQVEEFQLNLEGGRRYWFKAIIQPYGFAKGINCAQMILHDITELKEVQRALKKERDGLEVRVSERTAELRQSESRLQERLKELTCLYSIRQECSRAGAPDETLRSCCRHIRDSLSDPEDKLVSLSLDGRQISPSGDAARQVMTGLECELSPGGRKRGVLKVCSLHGKGEFLPFEHDLVQQAAACLADFISNRELEDQLLQSEKLAAAGRVAAGVAHEINNPLGAIKNALYVLRHAVAPEHPDYHYLGMMDNEVDRMASIIVQLYDLYKPSSREHQRIDLVELVGSVLKMLGTKISRQKITVHTVCGRKDHYLFLPRDQVIQVLYNIILNAVQAMPTGGELTLSCHGAADSHELSIQDTGPGIPDEVLPRIFEPFFSTKAGDRLPGQGMGMGLSLSRSIMESLGGSISVATRPGQGTTFSLHFPPPQDKSAG
ncbi:PAS domain S-box protein [bacterium]|nr:PAS domain S-box protein [bacterium]